MLYKTNNHRFSILRPSVFYAFISKYSIMIVYSKKKNTRLIFIFCIPFHWCDEFKLNIPNITNYLSSP